LRLRHLRHLRHLIRHQGELSQLSQLSLSQHSRKVSPHNTAAPFDREWFEERAAIYEFDAGFPRPEAERLARLEVTKWLH